MQEKYTGVEKGNRWSVKDIILAVILSLVSMVIFIMVNFLTMFNYELNLIFAMGILFAIISPLYIFASIKVNKRFLLSVFFAIYVIYCAISTWYNAILMLVALVIIEAFMWKKDSYKSLWKTTTAYTIMGAATVSMSYTTFLFWDSYQATALAGGMSQEYLDAFYNYYTNPLIAVGIYTFTAACGIIGCVISYRVLKNHFKKTGVL